MLSSGEVINQFKTVIHNIYGDRLDKIVMYGSRARGDFKEDSDFDFLVILKDGTLPASEEAMQVSDFVYELWEKTFLRIHFLPMAAQKFYNAKTPLLYWVRKEGKEI